MFINAVSKAVMPAGKGHPGAPRMTVCDWKGHPGAPWMTVCDWNAGIQSTGIVIRADAIPGVWIPAIRAGMTRFISRPRILRKLI